MLNRRDVVQLLLLLWVFIEDHDMLFVFAELSHFVGIGLLAYKLVSKKTCVGMFVAVRLPC